MRTRLRRLSSKLPKRRSSKAKPPRSETGFTRRHVVAAIVLVIAVSLLVVLVALPWVFTGSPWLWELRDYVQSPEPADRVALIVAQIQASMAFVQLLGGALLISVLYTGYQTMRHTQEQLDLNREELRVSREGQITERFTRAIEQLGATDEQGRKRIELRLGGIYALERIAQDSDKDHGVIMEVMTAYIRENAPAPSGGQQDLTGNKAYRPAVDIQAILTVVARRSARQRSLETLPLDLSKTDLRGVVLTGVHLEAAWLTEAHLEGARLIGAYLEGAVLAGARLQWARLEEAHLEGAWLAGAHLEGAVLTQTRLGGRGSPWFPDSPRNKLTQHSWMRTPYCRESPVLTGSRIDGRGGAEPMRNQARDRRSAKSCDSCRATHDRFDARTAVAARDRILRQSGRPGTTGQRGAGALHGGRRDPEQLAKGDDIDLELEPLRLRWRWIRGFP